MITIKRHALRCALVLVLLGYTSCAEMPHIKKPQFTHRYYTYSVLLSPEKLSGSPQLELALALLRMEYPAGQAEALHTLLYGQINLDEYKDLVVSEQRKSYRGRTDIPANGGNWRYAEKYSVKQIFPRGLVVQRDLETYSGGPNPGNITQFYNIEIDGSEFRQVTLDDFFTDFQEDLRFRDIVYAELREYSNIGSAQSLSQGIYYNNQPELTFNFFITEEGLGLHWDPAQIAPFSHGKIEIVLPWYVIQPIMLYTGIELLSKFNVNLF